MKSKIEKDLRAVFEAGKKCMQDHPDDDTYDQVRFEQAAQAFENSSAEIKKLFITSRTPPEVLSAQKLISDCEKDMGFMGSPEYYKAKEVVKQFNETNTEAV